MSKFTIDFFELAFLAEACIPPTPIARATFWQSLTDKYWMQMTKDERDKLFEWLNRNPFYPESLKENEDTQIFHARFDPDNQYMVETLFKGELKTLQSFKLGERYHTSTYQWIEPKFITKIEKI